MLNALFESKDDSACAAVLSGSRNNVPVIRGFRTQLNKTFFNLKIFVYFLFYDDNDRPNN